MKAREWIGPAFNLLLRVALVYFLIEVLLHPDDPRFVGKAITTRALIVLCVFSLLIPAVHFLRERSHPYRWWLDNLYLSIFCLDLLGNSLNLFDTVENFDLIPHFHGGGAASVVIHGLTGLPNLAAFGLSNTVHILLEAQEYYTDVFGGTHNVNGAGDTVHDLLAGVAGSAIYSGTDFMLTSLRERGMLRWNWGKAGVAARDARRDVRRKVKRRR